MTTPSGMTTTFLSALPGNARTTPKELVARIEARLADAVDERPSKRTSLVGPPKSRKGVRTIVLPEPLKAALNAHRSTQAGERLAAGELWLATRPT